MLLKESNLLEVTGEILGVVSCVCPGTLGPAMGLKPPIVGCPAGGFDDVGFTLGVWWVSLFLARTVSCLGALKSGRTSVTCGALPLTVWVGALLFTLSLDTGESGLIMGLNPVSVVGTLSVVGT